MLTRNRPRALALNLAICSSDTAVHFVDSREISGVYEYMAPGFVKRWHRKVRAFLVWKTAVGEVFVRLAPSL